MLERIQLRESPRDYYTQVPNMVDDLGLDPYAFRLFAHLRRVAGEYGECWQNTETLASACRMSMGKISQAKQILASKEVGLITIATVKVHGGDAHLITINDIWQENHEKYATPSCGEQAPSCGEQAPSPHETKKNPIRITLEEKPTSSASQNDDADALKVSTPGTRILFAKLQRAAADQGRRGPQKFRTRQQKDQAEAAEKRLDSHMADAVDAGLRAGITDLARMIAWVNKYTPGGAKKPAKPADPEHDAFVRDWAERLRADNAQVEG